MSTEIKIVEKPDWISWENIRQCLYQAHSVNRGKGINMAHYQWPAEKIRDSIEPDGVMFVALDGTRLVGTVGFSKKYGDTWFAKDSYAYLCFVGVIPEYNGRGVYKEMIQTVERVACECGYSVFLFNTHEKNKRMLSISVSNGYRMVGCYWAASHDHYNVVMAKWPAGCPYSQLYCNLRFYFSRIRAHLCAVLQTIRSRFSKC